MSIRIITIDETWAQAYELEMKQQSGSPQKHEADDHCGIQQSRCLIHSQ